MSDFDLEEIKAHRQWAKRHGISGDRYEDAVDRLISEVEKLRDTEVWKLYLEEARAMQKQIDSLTKELKEMKMNPEKISKALLSKYSTAESMPEFIHFCVSESIVENDEQAEIIWECFERVWDTEVWKLYLEKTRAMQKQIDSLTKEMGEWRSLAAKNGGAKKKLEAENAELKEELRLRVSLTSDKIKDLTASLVSEKEVTREFIEKGLNQIAEIVKLKAEVKSLENCALSWTTSYNEAKALLIESEEQVSGLEEDRDSWKQIAEQLQDKWCLFNDHNWMYCDYNQQKCLMCGKKRGEATK